MASTTSAEPLLDRTRSSVLPIVQKRIGALAGLWLVLMPRRFAPWLPPIADAFADGVWTAAWRNIASLAPAIAVVLGAAAPAVLPTVDHAYIDSLPFLLVVIASAIFSGPVGVTFLLGYVVGDAVRGGGQIGRQFVSTSPLGPVEKVLHEGGSQLLGYLLLAIPVLSLPRLASSLSHSLPVKLPANPLASVRLRLVIYPLVCGVLVYVWSQGMTVLSRPLFTWRGAAFNAQATATLQSQWGWLVLTAVIAGLVRVLFEEVVEDWTPWRTTVARIRHLRQLAAPRQSSRWSKLPLPVQVAVPTGLITLLLSGLYDGWNDALLVAIVSAVLSFWRLGVGGKLSAGFNQAMQRVPAIFRFLVALLIGYVGFGLIQVVAPSVAATSPTRPLLSAAVFSLIASHLLFPSRRFGRLAKQAQRLGLPYLPL
jgi:hypothetical protein